MRRGAETGKAEGGKQKAIRGEKLPTAYRLPPTALRPLIIGHRGAAALAPENTVVSFERALRDGADGIEFDVRLARDGQPVVIHDATLRRTVLRKGRVADFSATELSAMCAGAWFNGRRPSLARPEYLEANIPTLGEIFETFGARNTLLYVEMKCGSRDRAPLALAVARLIQAFKVKDRAVVESFDLPSIAELKRIDSGIRTAALFDRKLSRPAPSSRRMIELATECGAEEMALHRSLATRRRVEEVTERGLEVVVWTVDSPAWVSRAIKNGVRSLITNNPASLCARRARLA
ncbi:MAG TPA: glycerophosphodiester phosphodiesterase family protein [Pyrinomonadaceae bacterium]|nr:glycerophosphodiester phosphodiesterase family protein [Pyrinomonadaceae bacterium]